MESRMRGDMQVRFGAGMRKPTAERRQGVLYRAYAQEKAATSSLWQRNFIFPTVFPTF